MATTPEQKEEVRPNATSKVSLSHTSLLCKERYDNLRLGGKGSLKVNIKELKN
jgi:hypothetical protein